jgi:hypothetical protein
MRKVLLLTLAVLLVAFSAGNATLTRTLTMGDANTIVHDEANIWYFPQTLYDYPEMVIGEFYNDYYEGYYGSEDFTDIGIHYKFGEKKPFVLGLYFTKQQPYYIPNTYSEDYDLTVQDNRRIDLFYSRMLGGHKFGFHFDYIHGGSKYDNDTTAAGYGFNDHSEEAITRYGFNFGLTPNNGKMDLAVGLRLLSWTDKNYEGKDQSKPDGNISFDIFGRYFYEVDQKITLVPYAGIYYEKVGVKYYGEVPEDTVIWKSTYKYTSGNIGLGLNYTPAAGILAVGNIGFMLDKYNYKDEPMDTTGPIEEDDYNYTTIPYFSIGLDAEVFKWMDLRLGGTSYWQNYKHDDEYTRHDPYIYKYRSSYVWNETYLGAGFHWGNLFIDTYIDPSMITDGFNFISGESYPMNCQVSVKYKMF